MKKKNTTHSPVKKPVDVDLFQSVALLIEQSKERVIAAFNTELVNLYWNIGDHIRQNILQNKRAEYGKQIISTLSVQLTEIYGTGWSEKQLNHCLLSAETFSKNKLSLQCGDN